MMHNANGNNQLANNIKHLRQIDWSAISHPLES